MRWSLRILEDREEPLIQRPADGYPQLSVPGSVCLNILPCTEGDTSRGMLGIERKGTQIRFAAPLALGCPLGRTEGGRVDVNRLGEKLAEREGKGLPTCHLLPVLRTF